MRCRMTQALIHSLIHSKYFNARKHAVVTRAAWRYGMLLHDATKPWVLPAQHWNRPCCAFP